MIISVKTNVDEFRRSVTAFQDQIPFAVARAINETAVAAQKAVTAELPTIFDRPTPFTKRSVKVLDRASKTGLTATVGLQPIQAEYLKLEELGGTRTAASNTTSPAQALLERQQLGPNSYGNIPAGAVPKLRAQAAATSLARKANVAARASARGGKRARLFGAPRIGSGGISYKSRAVKGIYRGIVYIRGSDPQAHGRPGGFYRLSKGKLIPLILFASQAHYSAKFGFHERIGAVVKKIFPEALARAFAEAVRTRKP
jgi:hypothetical protein